MDLKQKGTSKILMLFKIKVMFYELSLKIGKLLLYRFWTG